METQDKTKTTYENPAQPNDEPGPETPSDDAVELQTWEVNLVLNVQELHEEMQDEALLHIDSKVNALCGEGKHNKQTGGYDDCT